MTREEKIEMVASEFTIGRNNPIYVNGFKAGAQWADANPDLNDYAKKVIEHFKAKDAACLAALKAKGIDVSEWEK